MKRYEVFTELTTSSRVEAPLSWYAEAEEYSFESVQLATGKEFIQLGAMPPGWSYTELFSILQEKFPSGFILRGIEDQSNLDTLHGGNLLHLGSSCTVSLKSYPKTKSIAGLSSRASRSSYIDLDTPVALHALTSPAPILHALYQTRAPTGGLVLTARSQDDSSLLGQVSVSKRSSWSYHLELLRRSPRAPVGTIEMLINACIQVLLHTNARTLSLGEVPFYRCSSRESTLRLAVIKFLLQKASSLLSPSLNPDTLGAFKGKFSDHWNPVYWYGWPNLTLKDFYEIARVTNTLKLMRYNLRSRFKRRSSVS